MWTDKIQLPRFPPSWRATVFFSLWNIFPPSASKFKWLNVILNHTLPRLWVHRIHYSITFCLDLHGSIHVHKLDSGHELFGTGTTSERCIPTRASGTSFRLGTSYNQKKWRLYWHTFKSQNRKENLSKYMNETNDLTSKDIWHIRVSYCVNFFARFTTRREQEGSNTDL